MKKYYILFLILQALNINCKQNTSEKSVADYYSRMDFKGKNTANIDFSKTNSSLINDIENQIKKDLCEDPFFVAKTDFNGIEVSYRVYVAKKCEYAPRIHGIVDIDINKENQVLVDGYLVEPENDIKDAVLKATVLRISDSRKGVLYELRWDSGLDVKLVKARVFELLESVLTHSNEVSKRLYNRNYQDLNTEEFNSLIKEYYAIIGFSEYSRLPPPPPPPMEVTNDLKPFGK